MGLNWLKLRNYASLILLGMTCLLTLWLFFAGKNLGHNKVIPNSHHDHIWSMGVAISDDYYNLKGGYLFYPEVCDTLFNAGLTHPLDSVGYPKNLQDKRLINNALDQAAHLSLNTARKSVSAGRGRPIACADLGLVDYYKLAFRLFGLRISAPYNFYFVLLFLILTCFIVNFWRSTMLLLVPVTYLISLLWILPSLADDVIYSTLFNMRHLPLLAIIPTLHILLLFLRGTKLNRLSIACLVFQSLLLSFIISVRVAAEWAVLVLMLPCIVYGARNYKHSSLKNWIKSNIALVIGALFFTLTYLSISSYKILFLPIFYGLDRLKQPSTSFADLVFAVLFSIALFGTGCFLFLKMKQHRRVIFKAFTLLFGLCVTSLVWLIIKERSDLNKFMLYCDVIIRWGVRLSAVYVLYLLLNFTLLKFNKSPRLFWKEIVNHKFASIVISLGIFMCYKFYFLSQLHPIYFSSEVLPSHCRYHNAYIGLASTPRFAQYAQGPDFSDSEGFYAGLNFFLNKYAAEEVTFDDYVSRVTGTYRMALHDQMVREAYIKFICEHPLVALDAHWCKFKALMSSTILFLKNHMNYLIGVFFLCLSFALLDQFWPNTFKWNSLLYACLCIMIGTGLPYLYAYPSHLCAEHVIIVALFSLFTATYLMSVVLKGVITKGNLFFRKKGAQVKS